MSKSKAMAWPAKVLSSSLSGPSGKTAGSSLPLNNCRKCSRSVRTKSMMTPVLPKAVVTRSYSASTLGPATSESVSLGDVSLPHYRARTDYTTASRSSLNSHQLEKHAFTTKPRSTQKNPRAPNRNSAPSAGFLAKVLSAFTDTQITPAPSITSSSPSSSSSGNQDMSLPNFQLLVHAKHPAAYSVRTESSAFHRELQKIHRIPSTIIPPLSVLHQLYTVITRQKLLVHLTGHDWNMFIFWLGYYRDRTTLAHLHSQLLGANSNISKDCGISESSRQMLIDSQLPSKPHGQDTNSWGPSTLATRPTSTDISTDKTKQPSTSTTTATKSNQTASRTKGSKLTHPGSSKSSPLSKDMDVTPLDNTGTTILARKKSAPLDFNTAMVDFKSALEEERTPSIEAANVLLRGLIRESRYEESVSFFHTLTEHHGMKPNADTYRGLIKLTSAYGQLAMTQRLISALKGLGVKRDAELSRDLMTCYVRSRNLTGAIHVFENMDRTGISKDIHHINVLLEGATGGDLTFPASPLPPSAASSAASSSIKVSPLTTVGILEIMASLKLRPNAKTWYHLLSGAIQARDRVLAQHMFLELSREVAGHKGSEHTRHPADKSDVGSTATSVPQSVPSIPVVGYASRHPDTFQLLVEEYARRHGAELAARLLKGALDAGYPSRTTPSLQRMQRSLVDQKSRRRLQQ